MTGASSDDDRWQALLRRDRAADGQFWYAVRTTGVYCRPSCAARRARRENVTFHVTPADAERAGFRPCRRCRPREATPIDRHAAVVIEACRQIELADEPPTLDTLAKQAGMSRFHFHRVFKAAAGVTPKAYADARRSQRVRDGLAKHRTVTDAIYDAGFNSSGRFYEHTTPRLGMVPKAFRDGGRGLAIRFAITGCCLGSILVAATDRGICAIELGDDQAALGDALRRRFPGARLIDGDAAFSEQVDAVVRLVDLPTRGLDLPLDIRGTAFQERVWRALREVPPGSTASYEEIARRIGQPNAARAVARACAANPLAVAVPCHRIVGRDGHLKGYRWGIERKRALLEREAGRQDATPPHLPGRRRS